MLKRLLCLLVTAACILPIAGANAKGFHVDHALLGGVIGYELGKATAHSEPNQMTSEGSNRAISQPAQAAPALPTGATIMPQMPPVIVTPECSSSSCVKEPEKKDETSTGFWIFFTAFIGFLVLVGTLIMVM